MRPLLQRNLLFCPSALLHLSVLSVSSVSFFNFTLPTLFYCSAPLVQTVLFSSGRVLFLLWKYFSILIWIEGEYIKSQKVNISVIYWLAARLRTNLRNPAEFRVMLTVLLFWNSAGSLLGIEKSIPHARVCNGRRTDGSGERARDREWVTEKEQETARGAIRGWANQSHSSTIKEWKKYILWHSVLMLWPAATKKFCVGNPAIW